MKERLRDLASRLLVASGVTRAGRRWGDRGGTLIFYGHRVADDDEGFFQGLAPQLLQEQLTYLTRHYEPIALRTLVECIEQGRSPPPRSMVITFDDGFRDNVEAGLPVLESLGIPATVFVVTGCLDDGRLPWSQRLGYLFQHSSAAEIQDPLLGPDPRPLDSEPKRRDAYRRAKAALVSAGRVVREAKIDELGRLLMVEDPRDRMMTWDHAKELLAAGHEVGAHTVSHPLLAKIAPGEARLEMEHSLHEVQERLGVARPSFCFPAGSTSPELRQLARELGFRSCFVPDPSKRLNAPDRVDTFSLVRLGLPNAPAYQLEAEVDGPFHALRRITGRYEASDDR